jgi:hypothetical protein
LGCLQRLLGCCLRQAQGWLAQRILWEECRVSRRCSRDTCPESYFTKHTRLRRTLRHHHLLGAGFGLAFGFGVWGKRVEFIFEGLRWGVCSGVSAALWVIPTTERDGPYALTPKVRPHPESGYYPQRCGNPTAPTPPQNRTWRPADRSTISRITHK